MGYKRVEPSVYVVVWDDAVVKVGYSDCQRWRKFLLRGGRLAARVPFRHYLSAMAAEQAAHAAMRASFPFAFDTIADSVGHLGPDGGGYCEAYRMQTVDAPALQACIARLHASADADLRCTNVTDGTHDTDALTNDVVLPLDISPVRYARRAAKR